MELDREVMVSVQMEDRSLADYVMDEKDAGRHVGRDAQIAYSAKLKEKQAPVRAAVEKMGGRVIGDFRVAYNGLQVMVKGKDLAALRAMPGVVGVFPVEEVYPDNETSVPFIGAPEVWEMVAQGLPV